MNNTFQIDADCNPLTQPLNRQPLQWIAFVGNESGDSALVSLSIDYLPPEKANLPNVLDFLEAFRKESDFTELRGAVFLQGGATVVFRTIPLN